MLRQAEGTTIRGLTRDDVLSYYRLAYRPDLTTIVVIGNVTVDETRTVIMRYFRGMARPRPGTASRSSAICTRRPSRAGAGEAVPDASRIQDNVVLAQTLALPRENPDYYALALRQCGAQQFCDPSQH